MPKIVLNSTRNNLSVHGLVNRHDELLDQPVKTTSDVRFSRLEVTDLYATGHIVLSGVVTQVESDTLKIKDDIIDLNADNSSPIRQAGLRIQRGPGLSPYLILYDEASKTMTMGFENQPQTTLASREMDPTDGFVAVWNDTLNRFDTTNVLQKPFTFSERLAVLGGLDFGGPILTKNSSDPNDLVFDNVQNVQVKGGVKASSLTIADTVFAVENGILTARTPMLNFTDLSRLGFGNAVEMYATGNILNVTGDTVRFDTTTAVDFRGPATFASVGKIDTAPNGIFRLTSTGDIRLEPGTNRYVWLPRLSLGGDNVHVITDSAGNLSLDAAGDISLSPSSAVVIANDKRLAFGNVDRYISTLNGHFVVNNTGGIRFNVDHVDVPTDVKMIFGATTEVYESPDGNFHLQNVNDITLAGRTVQIPANVPLQLGPTDRLSSNGSILTIEASQKILLTAGSSVSINQLVPLALGDLDHILYQDGANDTVLTSNHNIRLIATESVDLSRNVHVGTANLSQAVDGTLAIDSIKIDLNGPVNISDTTLATETSAGLVVQGGHLTKGNSVLLGDLTCKTSAHITRAVTVADVAVPVVIQNSGMDDGTAIGFLSTWDSNRGYTVGRGSSAVDGGRSLVFSVPTKVSYGMGIAPSFVFQDLAGTRFATIDETGLKVFGSLTTDQLVLNGTFSTANLHADTFSVTDLLTVDNTGVHVTTSLTVDGNVSVADKFVLADKMTVNVDSVFGNMSVASLEATSLSLKGNLTAGGFRITNLSAPLDDGDAASKGYVDTVAQGFSVKASVTAATSSNVDLAVPPTTIDDVALSTRDRILVKDQANPFENGIYVVNADGTWTRAADFDPNTNVAGSSVFVSSGTRYASVGFVVTGNGQVVVGTDPIRWTSYTGTSQIKTGDGLVKNENTLSVSYDGTFVGIDADRKLTVPPQFFGRGLTRAVDHAETSSDQSHVTKLGTIVAGTWNAAPIGSRYGGTGLITVPRGRLIFGKDDVSLEHADLFYDVATKRLGVGTDTPSSSLHVVGHTDYDAWFTLSDSSTTAPRNVGTIFRQLNPNRTARISLNADGTLYVGQQGDDAIVFATQQIGRMSIDGDGNVCMGTNVPNPGYLLTVGGNVSVKGISASYLHLPYANFVEYVDGSLLIDARLTLQNGISIDGDSNVGNVTFQTRPGSNSLISMNRTTNVGLPLEIKTSQTNTVATFSSGGFHVPGVVQIGGTSGDAASGYRFQYIGNSLNLIPGTPDTGLQINSKTFVGNRLYMFDPFAVQDSLCMYMSGGTFSIQSSSTVPLNFVVGGGDQEVVTSIVNRAGTGYVQYDPTDDRLFAGGVFSTGPHTQVRIGGETMLYETLRFDAGNSIEGTLANSGWYYFGRLGIGRTTIKTSLSWQLRLDYDGFAYSASLMQFGAPVSASLVIFKYLNDLHLYIYVSNAPCHVNVLETPQPLSLTRFEGTGARPDGNTSGLTGEWTIDYDIATAQSTMALSTGPLAVTGTSDLTDLNVRGAVNVVGALEVRGPSTFVTDEFTWQNSAGQVIADIIPDVDDGSTVLSLRGTNGTSPSLVLDRNLSKSSITVLSSADSTFPGALSIENRNTDPTSQIVFATNAIPGMLLDYDGTVNIFSTEDSTDQNTGALIVRGGIAVDKNLRVGTELMSPSIELTNPDAIDTAVLTCDAFGNLHVGNARIVGGASPEDPDDFVTKSYMDANLQGLSVKGSVTAATTAGQNLDLTEPFGVVDDVIITPGARVLVKNQTNKIENGIYVANYASPPTRSTDLAAGHRAASAYVFVSKGTTNSNSGWTCTAPAGNDVVGINELDFAQFNAAGEMQAGYALVKSGNRLDVVVDNTSIEVFADALRIKSSAVGTGLAGGSGTPIRVSSITHLNAVGVLTNGTWQANTIGMKYGGTGETNFAAGRIVYSNGVSLTQGPLYFDEVNVRVGINTTSPTSGLTLSNRDLELSHVSGSSCSVVYSSLPANHMYKVSQSGTALVWSSGTGNDRNLLTDRMKLDVTGALTQHHGITSPWYAFANGHRFSGNTLERTFSGPFRLDLFSADRSGSYANFYGALGTSATTDSELLRVGHYNGSFVLQTVASGTGTSRSLTVQTAGNTDQLVLSPTGSSTFGGSLSVRSTTDSTGVGSGALTVNGGASVNGRLSTVRMTVNDTLIVDGRTSLVGTTWRGQTSNYDVDVISDKLSVVGGDAPELGLHSRIGNGSGNVDLVLYGFGSPSGPAKEFLRVGYDSVRVGYRIETGRIGTAVQRPLILTAKPGQDQILLKTDGNVTMSGQLTVAGLDVQSNREVTSPTSGGSMLLRGGLGVGMSLMVGRLVTCPLVDVQDRLILSSVDNLDRLYVEHDTGGVHVYNAANTHLVLYTDGTQGPKATDQTTLTFGYKDSTAHVIKSGSTGSGLLKDLVLQTGSNDDQLRLTTDGKVTSNGPVECMSLSTLVDSDIGGTLTVGQGLYLNADPGGHVLGLGSNWDVLEDDIATTIVPLTAGSSLSVTDGAIQLWTLNSALKRCSQSQTFVRATSAKAFAVQDAADRDYFVVDTVARTLDATGGRLVNLGTPVLGTDACTKAYADGLAKGLVIKLPTKAASANINYDVTSPITTVDGVAVVPGDRILLMNQINAVENGVYVVLVNNMVTRATDMAIGSHAAGSFVFVQQGNVHQGVAYATTSGPDVVGTDPLHFSPFNNNIVKVADGIAKDENGALSIRLDDMSGLSLNAGKLRISPSLAGTGLQLVDGVLSVERATSLGTVTTGKWRADVIEIEHGGTGNSTYFPGGIIYKATDRLKSDDRLVWDDYNSGLKIGNGTSKPENGLTVFDKDIAVQGSGNGLSFVDPSGKYNWHFKRTQGSPLVVDSSVGRHPWTMIRFSADGRVGILLPEPNGGVPMVSNGYGWTPFLDDGILRVYNDVDLSADGRYILLTAQDDHLFVSEDYGVTWHRRLTDQIRVWEWCSMSSDGKYMMASALMDGLFVSDDYGFTWNPVPNVPTDVVDLGFVYVAGDGMRQFAGRYGGKLFVSTDYGTTFVENASAPSDNYYDVAGGPNANMLMYANPGYLYVSSDGGITWSRKFQDVPRKWTTADVSENGLTMAAAVENGLLYVSRDGGTAWLSAIDGAPRMWTSVKVKESTIVAVGNNCPVFMSQDGGITWTTLSDRNMAVFSVNLSNSAVRYVEYNGNVYTYRFAASTNLVLAGGSSTTKAGLTDTVVFTERGQVGIGYTESAVGSLADTLDVRGSLKVSDAVNFVTPLAVTSGGTGVNSLPYGLVIAREGHDFTSTGTPTDGAVPIGGIDGKIKLESGATLRSHIGLQLGRDVQAWNANLDALSTVPPTNGNFVVGDGTKFVTLSGAAARSALGLGALATAAGIGDGNWSGPPLSVANGGTGSTGTAFATGSLLTYDGNKLTSSSAYYDTVTGGLSVGGSGTTVGNVLELYGDVGIRSGGINFQASNGNFLWRTRYDTNKFVFSGGFGTTNKDLLTDLFTLQSDGRTTIACTEQSISVSTGAFVVPGGTGIGKNLHVGGTVRCYDSTTSTDTNTGSLVTAGGAGIGGNVHVGGMLTCYGTSTTSATFHGGLSIAKRMSTKGDVVVERGTVLGPLAVGMTISGDAGPWTSNTDVGSGGRLLTLANGTAGGCTALSLQTPSVRWDQIVEGAGANRLVWQSVNGTTGQATSWMTMDPADGRTTMYSTVETTSLSAAALSVRGGLAVTKTLQVGKAISLIGSVDRELSVLVANGSTGTAASSGVRINNDSGSGAYLLLNGSSTVDPNVFNIRNQQGPVKVSTSAGVGLIVDVTGQVSFDGGVVCRSTDDDSLTVLGGVVVDKNIRVKGNLVVDGAVDHAGATPVTTLTLDTADMVNVTTCTVYSARSMVINRQVLLTANFVVTTTSAAENTLFTFDLPNKASVLGNRLDVSAQCSGYSDDLVLTVLQNTLCTGVADTKKAVVKFVSTSNGAHYIQVMVRYDMD